MMQELLGKYPTKLWVSPDQHALIIETSGGDYKYETEGDCCSESWFADIIGVDALLHGEILGINYTQMDSIENAHRSRQEDDKLYKVEITTVEGHCDIIFRNSSNGYYGGWMNPGEKVDEIPDDFKEITNDWSA